MHIRCNMTVKQPIDLIVKQAALGSLGVLGLGGCSLGLASGGKQVTIVIIEQRSSLGASGSRLLGPASGHGCEQVIVPTEQRGRSA
mgnify:CR=1 FL=1